MRSFTKLFIFSMVVFSAYYEFVVECADKLGVEEIRGLLVPMSKSCKKKIGVPEELVANTHKGEFPKDRKLMCYFKCLSIALQVLDKDGNVKSPEELEEMFTLVVKEELVPRMKEIGHQCFQEVPQTDDRCEFSMNFVQCAFNKDKSLYFLPY